MLKLDHIAVAGETLQEAREAVENTLGVPLIPGGKHAVFGTHNCLLGLADGLYLEAIAIDPEAPPPRRTRWFDLDRFKGAPRLTNWICATDNLDGSLAQLLEGVGKPVALTRGELRWHMAVPADGVLPFDNLFPALIQWHGTAHPGNLLPTSGCRLNRLVLAHPDARELKELIDPILRDARVVIEPGPIAMMAEIETPHGMRRLQ